jgi:putative flippase GtrA
MPRYLLLVVGSGLASYALIVLIRSLFAWPVAAAKMTAESILFMANFVIQREVVFRRAVDATATDWRRYYLKTPLLARITRRYTTGVLLSALKRFAGDEVRTVVELGGGNSCFVEEVFRQLHPDVYHVVDTSEYGLELLRDRAGQDPRLRLHRRDVTAPGLDIEADAAFSVGLVEHFDRTGTQKAIETHLGLLRPGGYALIFAPTPTWLYRAARSACEFLGIWRFPDERPLLAEEIRTCVSGKGEVVFEKVLWPLVFTQRLMVIRKFAAGHSASTK